MEKTFFELIALLNRVQEKGNYTVFYSFSGHVNWFEFRIYKGKWNDKKKPLLERTYKITLSIIEMNPWRKTTWEEVILAIKRDLRLKEIL